MTIFIIIVFIRSLLSLGLPVFCAALMICLVSLVSRCSARLASASFLVAISFWLFSFVFS